MQDLRNTVLALMGMILAVCAIAFVVIYMLIKYVFGQELGNEKMQEIAHAIKDGAMAFLSRQYKTIAVMAIIVSVLLGFVTRVDNYFNWYTFISFIAGAICSGLSGFIGMYVAVSSNIRAAAGAKHSLNKSLIISFRGDRKSVV